MAWGWSHTADAYKAAQSQVEKQDREWLEIVFAEWEGNEGDDNLNEKKYKKALKHAKTLASDVLASYIWDKMSEQALCDNGGALAHCCPFGCGCHCVPFDYDEDDDEDFDDEDIL